MGHKISPTSLRLGITENWRSRWLSRGDSPKYLKEDHKIRGYINKQYAKAGILKIEIERYADQVHVIIRSSRPGMLIGRGGASVEDLRKNLGRLLNYSVPPRITIPTEDAKSLSTSAMSTALNIAEQTERRVPYRRVVKQTVDQVNQSNEVKGVKIQISGRLDGSDIARSETFQKGKIPLHTLRADIDFAKATAFTTYGTVGVKVWIYKGDILEETSSKPDKVVEKETAIDKEHLDKKSEIKKPQPKYQKKD